MGTGAVDLTGIPVRRPHLVRRLYNWTVGWADRPQGIWALSAIAFVDAFFPLVPPDILLVALAAGAPRRALRFAAVTSVASILGGMAGYAIGYGSWRWARGLFIPYVFSQALFDRVQQLYQANAFVAVLTTTLTPIPYKVFTLCAGVFQVDFWTFVGASFLARSGRFFLIGGLFHFFGPHIKAALERYTHWFAWGLLALGALLVALLRSVK